MSRIIIVPLDERPCNYNYPRQLGEMTIHEVVLPPHKLMGYKKRSADIENLQNWILGEASNASAIIISFDMIMYGGIIPSRLHNENIETLKNRLAILNKIKGANPDIKIYGYSLIMRNPSYSSSDEEPDYYQEWGAQIHKRGVYEHKKALDIISEYEENELSNIITNLPQEYYDDYTKRRDINKEINKDIIKLKSLGIIDELVIPQDDSSPYGLTKKDQLEIIDYIKSLNLFDDILIYPGADEVTLTLMSRLVCDMEKQRPRVYPYYRNDKAKDIIPLYEDRSLYLSVTAQIISAGCEVADILEESDMVLYINNAEGQLYDLLPSLPNDKDYDQEILNEFINNISDYKGCKGIADVYYANGSDASLVKELSQKNLLFSIDSYAGWNTSSNTLGTAISMLVISYHYSKYPQITRKRNEFLANRYVEDYLYQAIVRDSVMKCLGEYGCDYFMLDGDDGEVINDISLKMEKFATELFDNTEYIHTFEKCIMPWNRMFEIEVCISLTAKDKVIGIDIGGTKIKGGIIESDGYIRNEINVPTEASKGCRAILKNIDWVIKQLLKSEKVSAIGIGSAGRIDADAGRVIYATDNLPGWTGLELKYIIEKEYGLPTFVDNDCNVALLGEMWVGSGKNFTSTVMLTLGTGVGGAIYVDGRIQRGSNYQAGELGHMILYRGGVQCNCGKRGCVEQYLSGTALVKKARAKFGSKVKDGKDLMEIFISGNSDAIDIMKQYCSDLNNLKEELQVIIDPDCIIIGGGVIESSNLWWGLLGDINATQIFVKASLGNRAGMIGAGWLALKSV